MANTWLLRKVCYCLLHFCKKFACSTFPFNLSAPGRIEIIFFPVRNADRRVWRQQPSMTQSGLALTDACDKPASQTLEGQGPLTKAFFVFYCFILESQREIRKSVFQDANWCRIMWVGVLFVVFGEGFSNCIGLTEKKQKLKVLAFAISFPHPQKTQWWTQRFWSKLFETKWKKKIWFSSSGIHLYQHS